MWLLSPLSWLLLALLGAVLAMRFHRGRLLRLCVAAAVVAILAMTPLVANLLVAALEHAPAAGEDACDTQTPDIAVVLAGAVDFAPAHPRDFAALSLSSRRRVEAAVDWWHERPGRSLIMAGGPQLQGPLRSDGDREPVAASPGDGIALGRLMAAYAERLGVADAALRIEDASATTWENAHRLGRLQPAPPRRVLLVTSAMHMPRARYAMTHAGFEVCALPSESRHIPFGLPGYLIPGSSALGKTEAALHEIVGLLYYRWLAFREG